MSIRENRVTIEEAILVEKYCSPAGCAGVSDDQEYWCQKLFSAISVVNRLKDGAGCEVAAVDIGNGNVMPGTFVTAKGEIVTSGRIITKEKYLEISVD